MCERERERSGWVSGGRRTLPSRCTTPSVPGSIQRELWLYWLRLLSTDTCLGRTSPIWRLGWRRHCPFCSCCFVSSRRPRPRSASAPSASLRIATGSQSQLATKRRRESSLPLPRLFCRACSLCRRPFHQRTLQSPVWAKPEWTLHGARSFSNRRPESLTRLAKSKRAHSPTAPSTALHQITTVRHWSRHGAEECGAHSLRRRHRTAVELRTHRAQERLGQARRRPKGALEQCANGGRHARMLVLRPPVPSCTLQGSTNGKSDRRLSHLRMPRSSRGRMVPHHRAVRAPRVPSGRLRETAR